MLYWLIWMLPDPLFDRDYSFVLVDRQEQLLGAKISADEQWRFPEVDSLSSRYITCLITYEDKRYYDHIGVDIRAVARALRDNTRKGTVVSGASTITMQVMRLARDGRPRTYWQKVIEALWALRAELRYSKEEILCLYASHAPFGGNVVGIAAASWRYFGKDHTQLSWGEAALLAVLPNRPSMLRLDRNRNQLLDKRDALLAQLLKDEKISAVAYDLAISEPLPNPSQPLPHHASHLLDHLIDEKPEGYYQSTIDVELQQMTNQVLTDHYEINKQSDIYNASAIIIDTKTGEVLTYVGNAQGTTEEAHVDNANARRSSGSILKPLLYGGMLYTGTISPSQLVADVPTDIGGYSPENYHKKYSGAVPSDQALARSLNVPAVLHLKDFGVARFIDLLQQSGLTTIDRTADDYGLSLIIGGAEVSLLEVASAYAKLGRSLSEYTKYNDQYSDVGYTFGYKESTPQLVGRTAPLFDPGVIWTMFNVMQTVQRPSTQGDWESFETSRPIAWKTGTSYGNRDAWAVGITPEYTIACWVGNSDGEGRPDLIGVYKAGEVLFDIFNRLPSTTWFEPPYDYLEKVSICRQSGHLSSRVCPHSDSTYIPTAAKYTSLCPYHNQVHVSADGSTRYEGSCIADAYTQMKTYFVLPATMGTYYRASHPAYITLPPLDPTCSTASITTKQHVELIYPTPGTHVYIPVDLDGSKQSLVFEAATKDMDQPLHWHIDDTYIGTTSGRHKIELQTSLGSHTVTVVDKRGRSAQAEFTVESE